MLDKVRARRLLYARLAIPLALAALTGRLWFVQIVEGPQFRQQADQNHQRVDVIEPPRGIIYDRYDQQLVENAPSWVVSVVPADLSRAGTDTVLARLARLTGADLSQLQLAVRQDPNNAGLPLTVLTDLPREQALALKEQAELLPGVTVEAVAVRHYVDSPAFAQVLGYMGRVDASQYQDALHTAEPYAPDAMVGRAGAEQRYEAALRGQLGYQTVVVDAGGRTVGTLPSGQPETPGDSVELTLDAGVQRAAYQGLLAAMRRAGASGGAAVALDPRDGAVVALVSAPSFDGNLFATGISQADWQRLIGDPAGPLLNKAIAAQYPPGPMLDPFVALAALQEGIVPPDTPFPCPGVLNESGWLFYNPLHAPSGPVTLPQALAQRCDTLLVAVAGGAHAGGLDLAGMGQDRLLGWLRRFGFDQRTGIDLPAEAAGFLPDPAWVLRVRNAAWGPVDTDLVATGAGPTAVTPLQLAVATAALANGGTIWQPELLQRQIAPDGSVRRQLHALPRGKVPLTPAAQAAVLGALADSVRNGPSQAVRVAGLGIAGLGAAAAPAGGGTGQPGLNAWWSGFAPLDDPQLVVTVLLAGGDDPTAAQAVARAIFQAQFAPAQAEADRRDA